MNYLERLRFAKAGVPPAAKTDETRPAPIETPRGATDKTDKTVVAQVSSVLSVPRPAICREKRPQDWPSEHLAALATRVCLWRVEESGLPARFVIAGPDHDLRETYPGAVPLFTDAHRDYVKAVANLGRERQP